MILDLIARLKDEGNVSIIMILHNYVHVSAACDRVNLIQDGVIALDKPTAETSVDELNEIVVEEYRRARQAAHAGKRRTPAGGNDAPALTSGDGTAAPDERAARRSGGPRPLRRRLRGVGVRRPMSRRTCASGSTSAPSPGACCCSTLEHRRGAGGQRRPLRERRDRPRAAVAPASRCRRTGRCRIPTTGSTVIEVGVPDAAGAQAGVDPDRSSDSASTSPRARCCRSAADGVPLSSLERWRGHRARVAEAVEAPRGAAGRRPAQRGRARARRGAVPSALRRPDLLGVVLPEADRAVARGSRASTTPRAAFVEATDWIVWWMTGERRARPAPPRTRRCGPRTTGSRRSTTSRRPTPASTGRRTSWAPCSCRSAPAPGRSDPIWRVGSGCRRRWRSRSATSTRSCRCRAPGFSVRARLRDGRRDLDLRHARPPR